MLELPTQLSALQQQLLDAAQKFATDAQPLSELLTALVNDVARAAAEPLEIFPVCHHSPASALQIVQRLHRKQPKAIYLELCEDLLSTVEHLRDCKLPVALQAFAAESETFPAELLPLSVVAPLTEASAEYQAIAYALQHPDTAIVFVDRAVDFVFLWQPQQLENPTEEDAPTDEAKMHGRAVGVEMGSLVPTFDSFLTFLLHNSNCHHFAEWWERYVEQAIIGSDYETYRQVMFLIGSLMRRLGSQPEDIKSDRQREQYMWTRLKQHMNANQIAANDAIYICGAVHAASDVAEFGLASNVVWEIPALTQSKWHYGLIASSFAAIEYQFNHPAGTVSLAEKTWKKSLSIAKIQPFTLEKLPKQRQDKPNRHKSNAEREVGNPLMSFLTSAPDSVAADEAQLLAWCADIVALARKNGYLASTADAIAIHQTSLLLAAMRNRTHPTPYDFTDAAITCLEKDRTPKKRNVQQLCQILLGGDRIGMVGYTSLPPLAQNVYDRLAPLSVNLQSSTNQRALMDFKQQPELLPCSDVLWQLNYLLGDRMCQPIMGDRTLGHQPLQESWEIRIGKYQREIIMLGYEGVIIEQVLEQRLRQAAFGAQTRASTALKAVEDSILYLHQRLTQELGEQAISLLQQETGAEDAPSIFERVRRLVHYYRTTPSGLPHWIQQFVATGYSHYATLLPQAFADRGTSPEQIAGMLGFIFTLESLALSLGCNRSQLLIGVQQASDVVEPAKLGLLWTTEWLLKQRTLTEIRDFFEQVLSNPMLTPAFPDYLNGFILALTFAPPIGQFVVEILSKVFASVPDHVLLPWLPSLILRLRSHAQILPALISEAAGSFPNNLSEFEQWLPPWLQVAADPQVTPTMVLSEQEKSIRQMLLDKRTTTSVMPQLLGVEADTWLDVVTTDTAGNLEEEVRALLHSHPSTMVTLGNFLQM